MSVSDHILERQRNSISFGIFVLKTLVVLSSGTVVALLALVDGGFASEDPNVLKIIKIVLPYFVLSSFYSVGAAYLGYWSEYYAYNQGMEDTPDKIKYCKDRCVILFYTGHIYTLLSAAVFFGAALFFTWSI